MSKQEVILCKELENDRANQCQDITAYLKKKQESMEFI